MSNQPIYIPAAPGSEAVILRRDRFGVFDIPRRFPIAVWEIVSVRDGKCACPVLPFWVYETPEIILLPAGTGYTDRDGQFFETLDAVKAHYKPRQVAALLDCAP